jgi:hypothetical protein
LRLQLDSDDKPIELWVFNFIANVHYSMCLYSVIPGDKEAVLMVLLYVYSMQYDFYGCVYYNPPSN